MYQRTIFWITSQASFHGRHSAAQSHSHGSHSDTPDALMEYPSDVYIFVKLYMSCLSELRPHMAATVSCLSLSRKYLGTSEIIQAVLRIFPIISSSKMYFTYTISCNWLITWFTNLDSLYDITNENTRQSVVTETWKSDILHSQLSQNLNWSQNLYQSVRDL
jgi:hypothetical protein